MKTFRVATLNIWNRFGPWEARLAAIRETLRALGPDLLGLQEVVKLDSGQGDSLDQAGAIAEGLGYETAYSRAHDEPWLGNAALSRWPILRSQTFELPRAGTDERRTLLHADVEAPFGKVPFFVTHLNWRFDEGHVREAQVREIALRIESIVDDEGFPAILVGDFNAESDSDEMRYLRGLTSLGAGRRVYFQDAFALAGNGSPGCTYARANPLAAPLAEPDRRIDYVLVRGRDDRSRGQPIGARVCFDQPVDGTFPSDHFGVIATLRTGA
ncbi:MAG TPA: endonuclease/exonuclease/phosphatase family protein [Polyangiaceae bacterium]|nr:endonuclease/exonuclease/phosphatase family protein [Polyangiaceae bacterium]